MGEFLDLETLGVIRTFRDFACFSKKVPLYTFFTENRLNYRLPFLDFRYNYFNTFSFSDIDENYILFTLGVDLRLEMPMYHLILRQKLKNKYNQRVMGFGTKSLATNHIFSNNLKSFIHFLEGNLMLAIFLKNI